VLFAVLLLSPMGVAALFAFARFADRNFRDSLDAVSGGWVNASRGETNQEGVRVKSGHHAS
jgi:hypothetical protein